MRIAVINGSPKGKNSVTLQYVHALQKRLPDCTFVPLHVAAELRLLEREPARLEAVARELAGSDFILWSFPVYYTVVPGQLKRFIELMEERGLTAGLANKPACALSTSIRFFDHTAHEYLHELSERWDLHYFRGYSCHMEDLFSSEPREKFLAYFEGVFRLARERAWPRRRHARETPVAPRRVKLPVPTMLQGPPRRVVLVSTVEEKDSSLARMITYLKGCFPFAVTHFELTEEVLRSGCLGCLNCSIDNVCAVKDRSAGEVRDAIHQADAIVYAAPLRDVHVDGRFKMFLDRRFIDGHCPIMQGKPLGVILSGPLRQLAGARAWLEAFADMSGTSLLGPVTDEDSPDEIVRQLSQMASVILVGDALPASPTFHTVGGMKLFRDFIWSHSAIFPADHRYYKKHGFYDFPQGQAGKRLQNLGLTMAFALPGVRRAIWSKMIHHMLTPYRRAVDKL